MSATSTSLCPPRPARRRPAIRSLLDAALVALAFGVVGAVTVVGTGPEPGPHAVSAATR